MTPQELKNSILQLAIQGKLVDQRPEEGTAQELYAQIQAEKQRLIKEGKLKKEKPLPEITEDEKPFEIPEGWMWVRIKEITILNPKNDLDDNLKTSFIPMTLLSDGYRSSYTYEIRSWGEIKKGFTHFAVGDIGIAKITPCFQNRKSAIFTELENNFGAGTTELSIVRVIQNTLSRKYLLWFFKSAYFIENGIKSFTGTAGQQRIHKDYLSHCVFPLPPLSEQNRIVAKIEELLPLVDRYEQAWTKMEDFNHRFPEDMKKSILQQAIQGKLVEQRPEEGTAQELYAQIQAEKQRLIKEGKLKKEKPLPEIAEDEKPFEIPDGWMWVRWGDLSESIQYGFNAPAQNSGRIKMVRISDIQDGKVLWGSVPFCQIEENEIPKYLLKKNDILFARTGGTVGKSYLVREVSEEAIYAGYLIRTRYSSSLVPEYLKCFMESPLYWDQLKNGTIATAQPNCNGKTLSKMILPLPPLAEQKRIVARLEELLPLCERLK
ncbi:restriction endonuclease subunit S [Faecalibacterium sp. An192]|uniref:restriction endonuclease subunit S n=1 Tax=Faecalibacterium sp. An192 TaxID=1965581 RepID=UPI000B3685C2|nr:restriction endonuclease subunit S [Faecalibacterium sp. An192]OUP26339.1 hypothetical protein B5F27_13885 [Faecalibacterium sp. An192]